MGNLKVGALLNNITACNTDTSQSHQNKFHLETIKKLKIKFEAVDAMDHVTSREEREIWAYLRDLYKHSNKGIKGRGRDRKVGPPNSLLALSEMRHRGHVASGYDVSSPGRRNVMVPFRRAGSGSTDYEIFDGDDASQASGHSTTSTFYDDDTHCNTYMEVRRQNLGFGDRLY